MLPRRRRPSRSRSTPATHRKSSRTRSTAASTPSSTSVTPSGSPQWRPVPVSPPLPWPTTPARLLGSGRSPAGSRSASGWKRGSFRKANPLGRRVAGHRRLHPERTSPSDRVERLLPVDDVHRAVGSRGSPGAGEGIGTAVGTATPGFDVAAACLLGCLVGSRVRPLAPVLRPVHQPPGLGRAASLRPGREAL